MCQEVNISNDINWAEATAVDIQYAEIVHLSRGAVEGKGMWR